MGLHISREIIKAQGGRVEVQSEIGQGATFFWLSCGSDIGFD